MLLLLLQRLQRLKKKRDYGTTPARLHIGKKAFEKWQKCVAEGTTYEYVFEDACSGAASKAGAAETDRGGSKGGKAGGGKAKASAPSAAPPKKKG